MPDNVSTEIAHELSTWTLEQRQEAGPAMEELEQMPGFEIVTALAERVRKRKLESLLAADKPREAAEYARDLGEINGLRIAEQIVSTVKAKAEDADKQLEQRLAGAAAEAR
jgi:hypothetical protein